MTRGHVRPLASLSLLFPLTSVILMTQIELYFQVIGNRVRGDGTADIVRLYHSDIVLQYARVL